jgi:hypothetical protein
MALLNWLFFAIIAGSALLAFLGLFTPVFKAKEGDCQFFLWGPEESTCHFTLDDIYCGAVRSRFRAMTAFGVFAFLGGIAAVLITLLHVVEKISQTILVPIVCGGTSFCCMIAFAVTASVYNTNYNEGSVACVRLSESAKYSFSIAGFIMAWIGFIVGGVGYFIHNRRSGFSSLN